jgi:hypothetical protein
VYATYFLHSDFGHILYNRMRYINFKKEPIINQCLKINGYFQNWEYNNLYASSLTQVTVYATYVMCSDFGCKLYNSMQYINFKKEPIINQCLKRNGHQSRIRNENYVSYIFPVTLPHTCAPTHTRTHTKTPKPNYVPEWSTGELSENI